MFVPFGNINLSSLVKVTGERKEGVARLEFPCLSTNILNAFVMINNTSLQRWDRLLHKDLSQQFINKISRGLHCSPFEAKAILNTVHEVFQPYFQTSASLKPGQIQLICTSIDNSPKTKLADCNMITVTLTLNDNDEDIPIRKDKGIKTLRQHRMQRICVEAFQQGGLLTIEDLAYKVFNCGVRTLSRDIKELQEKGVVLPLRSIVKDMGRSISHRKLIVKHWLLGKEYSLIARETSHSIESVQNYISKFKRTVALTKDGFDIQTIAFLVKMSSGLVEEYYRLYQDLQIADHRKKELEKLLKKTEMSNPKNMKNK